MDPKRIIVSHPHDGAIRVGDVLVETGPRIGARHWLVADTRIPRTLVHCICVPVDGVEQGDHIWILRRRAE